MLQYIKLTSLNERKLDTCRSGSATSRQPTICCLRLHSPKRTTGQVDVRSADRPLCRKRPATGDSSAARRAEVADTAYSAEAATLPFAKRSVTSLKKTSTQSLHSTNCPPLQKRPASRSVYSLQRWALLIENTTPSRKEMRFSSLYTV